jgi:hypothetical protein
MKGQATLEALGSIIFLCITLSSGLLALYIGFAHAWLSYSVHEGVMCIAENQTESRCRSEMLNRAKKHLAFGEITTAKLQKFENKFTGEIILTFTERKKWEIKETFELTNSDIQRASRFYRL